jgi:GNAT superfamily N-acetyltransferase
MKPLLQALNAWNEEDMECAFKTYFNIDEIRIVTLNGRDVGWIQISRTAQEFCLDQVHLVEEARDMGIGTRLIEDTIAQAAAENKNVSLSLVKGNRAIALYKRMGFEHVAEDSTKIHKRYVTRRVT